MNPSDALSTDMMDDLPLDSDSPANDPVVRRGSQRGGLPDRAGLMEPAGNPIPPALAARVAPTTFGNQPPTLYDRVEAFVSRLSMRDNFWNSICSLIWLPLAFFSGIRLKEIDVNTYMARAVLPFRRFNRNWYRAMAGGALLANSEIAGGSYVFGICGGDYTVVCKNLDYKFLRPCLGPAVYRIKAREDIKSLMAGAGEFNITVDMDVTQQASRLGERDKRVGQCVATFHVTPKILHKNRAARKKKRF
jgi:hypothetical protein